MRRHLFSLGHRHPDGSETWDGHKYSQWTSHRLLFDLADRRGDLQLTGVDLSASMIEQAQENSRVADVGGRITFDISDAASLPYQNHSFDLAVSSFSMHH